jgi:hypothetical protein
MSAATTQNLPGVLTRTYSSKDAKRKGQQKALRRMV